MRIPETEAGFQRAVVELAKLHGWMVHAERPAKTNKGYRTPIQGDAGFPDLVLAKAGRVIFAELKSERGHLSRHQKSWSAALPDLHIWRPGNWTEIESILMATERRRG